MKASFSIPINVAFQRDGYTFTRDAVENAVSEYQSKIKENTSLGELNHPAGINIDLSNVSHIVRDLKIDGENIVGEVEVLTSPGYDSQNIISTKGDMFAELLKHGVPYAFEPIIFGNEIRSINVELRNE